MSANPELLQQVRWLDPSRQVDTVADILLADGQIAAIAPQIDSIPERTQVRDARGQIFAPGLVDLYSHSGEPGREDRETLASLSAAAAAGGFTRVGILPDTVPPLDNPASVRAIDSRATEPVRTFSWGALTKRLEGQQMSELAELAAAGIVGFTDGRAIADLGRLRRILEYVQPLGKPVALVASDRALRGSGVAREGGQSLRAGLPGDPGISETAALAAILEVVASVGAPVHLMRISTARSVELIAAAKERGLPVTASTTWMHLLLETTALKSYDASLRLDPPLGNPEDRSALAAGVKAGIIDAIAIDHAPYTYEEKAVAFAEAPPGAIGLELALPLLWQAFVETHQWTALELWRALSLAPCLCWQQPAIALQVGSPVEAVLFDPQLRWTVDRSHLHSTSSNTPWWGQTLTGKAIALWTGNSLSPSP